MARPKLGESDTERLHMKITTEELQAIEDWRYANRVPSKSEAVRRLTAMALFLDRQIQTTDENRRALWETFSQGSEHLIKEVKADVPDWRTIALDAIELLGDLARPQAALSHSVNAMAEMASRLREDLSAADAIASAQRAETEAKDRLKTLSSLYNQLDKDQQ